MLEVLGDGHEFETVTMRFLCAEGWPYLTIRKDRVGVEVSGQDNTSVWRIRKVHGASVSQGVPRQRL